LAPPVGYSFLYPNDCPNNFNCFKDLKEGVAYAQKVNKPILLDFTGYACVNCRKMEEHIWPKSSIKPYFEEDYVLISLYVDDKKELPENQKLTVKRPVLSKIMATNGHIFKLNFSNPIHSLFMC
jgi:thioredoxin-related protein